MNVLVMGSVTERLACAHVLEILLSQIALNLVGHSAPGGWMEYVLVTVFVLCMGVLLFLIVFVVIVGIKFFWHY